MSDVDLVIPTITGREASLDRCVASFEASGAAVTVILVKDEPTCGEGWMKGLERATAPHVALVADDLELRAGGGWLERCRAVTDEGLLPCPRVWTPGGAIESQGGDMSAVGHTLRRHRKNRAPVDFTTVPFMSRAQATAIGMIPTQYCCDTWVSYRGRQLGWETVLCHGWDLVHHHEMVGRGAGMTQADRDFADTEVMYTELQYGTHLPVLREVLERVRPQRVLEVGAGRYSTREFLSYPGVKQLDSVETDPVWQERVERELADPRLHFHRSLPNPHDYDLVFVDGPEDREGRCQAIRDVLTQPHPVTVIHDAEQEAYRKVIEALTNGEVEYISQDAPRFLKGDELWTVAETKETAVCW